MINYLLLLTLVVTINVRLQSQTSNDTIPWSADLKLTANDFKAVPDNKSKFKGYSFTSAPNKWHVKNDTLYITVRSTFLRHRSWLKGETLKPNQLAILLLHEAGHFNIVELKVRKIKKKFSENQYLITPNNFRQIITQYLEEFKSDLSELQKIYDKETNFSKDYEKQKEWSSKIEKEIKELDNFRYELLKLPLKKNP